MDSIYDVRVTYSISKKGQEVHQAWTDQFKIDISTSSKLIEEVQNRIEKAFPEAF